MLDTHARKYVNPIIELGAEFLLKLGYVSHLRDKYEIKTTTP